MRALNGFLSIFEENQRRKREHSAEFFRTLATRRGMLFLGVVLFAVAIGIFLSARPEKPTAPEGNIVIDVSEMFADDPELQALMERAAEDAAQRAEKARNQNLVGAFVLAVAAVVCLLRAALMKPSKPVPAAEDSGPISPEEPSGSMEKAPSSVDLDSREDRLTNLRRLYDAGILSKEEYEERRARQ